jgi:hypothetical protein
MEVEGGAGGWGRRVGWIRALVGRCGRLLEQLGTRHPDTPSSREYVQLCDEKLPLGAILLV